MPGNGRAASSFHMRYPTVLPRLVVAASGLVLLSGLPSCRKPAAAAAPAAAPAEVVPELLSNRLGDSPSTFLADQASSPVHWQPWSRETLERARRADRLIFAVFALPQQAESLNVLKAINAEPSLVGDLNSNFVPTLVDSDACRETGLLASALCSEIKQPFSMPLFVWMTPDGNPVAWIPAKARKGGLRELCEQSSSLVSRMWRESAESHAYILNNSKSDNAARAERLAKAGTLPAVADPARDGLRALRQLATFYDAGSHSFDNAGGLFPSAGLEVFSSVSLVSGIPADVAGRCREASEGLAADLSASAMLDPLDGCIYSARWGGGWDLPSFTRDGSNHARALTALACAARATKTPRLAEQVVAGIDFAEKNYATSDGLFALGRQDLQPRENWLWSLDQLEKALSPEELKVWTAVSGLKNLGNIPMESDPNREQFRRNSLAVKVAPEAVAAKLGLAPTAAREQFESGRRKILKLRQERGAVEEDSRPHAVATFRMVSAYAAAYSLTGDPAWRKKAVETFDHACETFAQGSDLRLFPGKDGADMLGDGRAFLYGVAMQAALDVADVTLDPAPVAWAERLAAGAAAKFLDGANLRETTAANLLIDVPMSDRTMIYDDSSVGLLAAAEARLSRLGRTLPEAYATAVVPLPKEAVDSPIIHADLLQAFLIRYHAPVVIVAADAAPALKDAVSRLPLRAALRRPAVAADDVPAGQAKILFADGTSKTAAADVLATAILTGGPVR